jgi:cold shock protein
MAQGIISWLTVRGFGFIDQGTGEDLFFRGTALENVAFAALRVGDRVEFDTTPDPHGGDQAVHVRRIEAQPPLAERTPEHAR